MYLYGNSAHKGLLSLYPQTDHGCQLTDIVRVTNFLYCCL